jgi:hypothetical protein
MATRPPGTSRRWQAETDNPANPSLPALAAGSKVTLPIDGASLTDSDFQLPSVALRERVLPLRQGDLTRLLLAEPSLGTLEREGLANFGRMLGALLHHQSFAKLKELKELYAPLDPDSDYVQLQVHSRDRNEHSFREFLEPFRSALERANYMPLDFRVIYEAVTAPNESGLTYRPDFSLFEHLMISVRGYTQIERVCRNAQTGFRRRVVRLDAYQRMVLALKFKPEFDLGPYVRSDVLYLKMFKDVPHVDMEMHLPEQGTKVRMRWVDKAQVASPLVMGIPTIAAKILFGVFSPLALSGLILAPISAGLNSFFGFHRAKQRHLSAMIRSLYYLTLANNASVLTRLVDSAEDEDYKEVMLAYFFLCRAAREPQPWDRRKLDTRIEGYLEEKTGIHIDFQVGDALNKLFRLGLVTRDAQGFLHAVPVEQALQILQRQWNAALVVPARSPGVPH